MSTTETQYTVKVPLNPTNFPTNDKVVIWDESEGRFNLGSASDCQLTYQWNSDSPVQQPPSSGELMMTTQSFSAETPNVVYIGLSLTSYTGNDLTDYYGYFNSASIIVTQQNDSSYFMAFNANVIAITDEVIIFQIITESFSSSAPPISGTPSNGELLCVSISPISASNSIGQCQNIDSIDINFGTIEVGDTQQFTGNEGLSIITGDTVQISYTPSPNIFVLGIITDYNLSTGVFTVEITYVSNDGYTSGSVDESVTCYYYFTDSTEFIFKRTLFVDPNGNDGVASDVSPIGGTLHPPFQTIQGAIQYAQDNYVSADITIHVFAGTYYISETNPIVLGYNNLYMNLYLEDGAVLSCTNNSPSTDPNDPSFFIKITGDREVSISGHGKISTNGTASSSAYQNIFEIDPVDRVNIKLKRINGQLRENQGTVFYYSTTGDSLTNTFFEGEVLIDSVNLGLLTMEGTDGGSGRTFEFGHETIINISDVDTSGMVNKIVDINYQSTVIVRGNWYILPSDTEKPRALFYYRDDSARVILDGADMYLNINNVVSNDTKKLMINLTSNDCFFEKRTSSLTNSFLLPTENIYSQTYGTLEQNVPITPIILPQ